MNVEFILANYVEGVAVHHNIVEEAVVAREMGEAKRARVLMDHTTVNRAEMMCEKLRSG